MRHQVCGLGILMVLAAGVALAPGCASQPSSETSGPSAAERERAAHIQAIQPINMAQDVSRRPAFLWRLPSGFQSPQFVTFKLFEVGPTLKLPDGAHPEETPDAGPGENEVAVVTGLAEVSSTQLDLFAPPFGAIKTGEIWDKNMVQLKPNTWYHWKIRAVSTTAVLDSFYFMTRAEDAVIPLSAPSVPEPEPETNLHLPPMPAPLPPTSIDTGGKAPASPAK
jgi:hypothetical protein